MKKIKGYIELCQTREEFEFEVDDKATDEEIEEQAKEEAFDFFNWGYWEVDEGENNEIKS